MAQRRLHRGIGKDEDFRKRLCHVFMADEDLSLSDLERRFGYCLNSCKQILIDEGCIEKKDGRWVRTQGAYGINSKMDNVKAAS